MLGLATLTAEVLGRLQMVVTRAAVRGAVVTAAALMAAAGAGEGFRVTADERGVWAFEAPDGRRFISMGINHITPEPFMPRAGTKYYDAARQQFAGDIGKWAAATEEFLTGAGLNTIGCWSHVEIPARVEGPRPFYRTHILYVAAHAQDRPLEALRPDFEDVVRQNARAALAELKDRDALLGLYLDNEAAWWGKTGWDKIPTYTLLDVALEKPADHVYHKAAVRFLRERHPTPAALAAAHERPITSWDELNAGYLRNNAAKGAIEDRTAFTAHVAREFFQRSAKVVREEAPGVLVLGARFAGDAPDAVIEECGKVSDVMSVNIYNSQPQASVHRLTRFWVLGKKPILITEWAFRARENQSGNPNTRGAAPVVDTQAERAAAYEATVEDNLLWPMVVGLHWFEFADQSPQGRFDGEDSNYGVVDIQNRPYPALVAAMKRVHARVPELRSSITRTAPTELPSPTKISFAPQQHPERPADVSLLRDWAAPPATWTAPDGKIGYSRRGDEIVINYDAGAQWGVGIDFYGPAGSRVAEAKPPHVTDVDGYATIVVELTAPKGLTINAALVEAGAAEPSARFTPTGTDADGEAYETTRLDAAGGRQTFKFPIAQMQKQQYFGNQGGNSRIDTAGLRTIGLQFQGTPAKGEVIVHALRLEK